MNRLILKALTQWRHTSNRPVLLLRGARQVGKTWVIREFGRGFPSFVEINFERDPVLASAFLPSLSPVEILSKLSAYTGKRIIPGETMLFLDEIQSCPAALRSLRFFYEEQPALHLIAAGSLLEFAIEEIPSFGVGRIASMFLHPMCFGEFLDAVGMGPLNDALLNASPVKPLDEFLHARLLDQLRTFQLIGGMPAVVAAYCESRDILSCQPILDRLLDGFRADFAKYRKRMPAARLDETLYSVVHQAGAKFKYANVSQDAPGRVYRDSLELLVQAGLVHKIVHSSGNGLPLGAEANPKKFKAMLFDIGLHQRMLGLDLGAHLLCDGVSLVNKGNLAEVFTGLEMIAASAPHERPALHYWQREQKSSNAEVDYLAICDGAVVPVEVKAGIRGQMQSLHLFMKEHQSRFGIRVSHENFGSIERIRILPLYAASHVSRQQ